MELLLAPAPKGWKYLSGHVAEITEDHGDSWSVSPRDQTCSLLSQMENKLIRKQGGSGVFAQFKAARSSEPAEITAGVEEGSCGSVTCSGQGLANNSTAQAFNRMWNQPQDRLGCRKSCQGCQGSEGREGGCTIPAAFYQALHFLPCCCSIP